MTRGERMAALQAAHPEWTLWLSDSGTCYATRHRRLRGREIDAGLVRTLAADDAIELTGRLRIQEGLEDRLVRS